MVESKHSNDYSISLVNGISSLTMKKCKVMIIGNSPDIHSYTMAMDNDTFITHTNGI